METPDGDGEMRIKFLWSRNWATPIWLNTWYGPQIQLGWLTIVIAKKDQLYEDAQ